MTKKTIGGKRLVMTKNLIMMLVMLVVIFVAIFAWYTSSYAVTAETNSISAKSADNVELAVPEKIGNVDVFPLSNASWKPEIDFSNSGYLKNLVKDITSGGNQFVVPNFEAASGLKEGRKVIADDVWTDGLSSKEALTNTSALDDDQYNYISLDFYVRSKSKDINVTSESFLAAGSELGIEEDGTISETPAKKPLKGSNIYRCSTYGAQSGTANAFSADAVVGAMRVSLVGGPVTAVNTSTRAETLANQNLRFLWLPRPDLYLSTDNNSNNWKLYTGIKPSNNTAQGGMSVAQINEIANQTYVHSFYEGNIVTGGVKKGLTPHTYNDTAVKTVDGAVANDIFKVSKITSTDTSVGTTGYYPTLGQSANVANDAPESSKQIQFTREQGDNRDTTGYYVYKYTLNIWIEGEDAEARRSMNNGVFSLELDFGT